MLILSQYMEVWSLISKQMRTLKYCWIHMPVNGFCSILIRADNIAVQPLFLYKRICSNFFNILLSSLVPSYFAQCWSNVVVSLFNCFKDWTSILFFACRLSFLVILFAYFFFRTIFKKTFWTMSIIGSRR